MTVETQRDVGARRAGGVILGVGVALLLAVFAIAVHTFAGLPRQMQAANASTLEGAGRVLAIAGARAVLLFAMAYAGSLVASKGLELYHFATHQHGS